MELLWNRLTAASLLLGIAPLPHHLPRELGGVFFLQGKGEEGESGRAGGLVCSGSPTLWPQDPFTLLKITEASKQLCLCGL